MSGREHSYSPAIGFERVSLYLALASTGECPIKESSFNGVSFVKSFLLCASINLLFTSSEFQK